MNNATTQNNLMNVNVKRLHPDAVVPEYATDGSAGLDLTAVSKEYDENGNITYLVGLAFEIPKGFVGLLFPRSSISKKDLALTNSVGVIDSDYRGDIGMKFKPTACFMDLHDKKEEFRKVSSDFVSFPVPTSSTQFYSDTDVPLEEYEVGERIGQIIIMPVPRVKLIEVDDLTNTERGSGGYGSTGK